jgi:aspartate racemase
MQFMSRRTFVTVAPAALAVGAVGCAGSAQRRDPAPASGVMRCIGVLGGLGPQATMDFEQRLHRAAQRRIPPSFNSGYPPLVVHFCRHAPFVIDERGMPVPPLRADPRLLTAARKLGAMADFLVIPSNGAHLLREQIEAAAGLPVLSMIDATLAEVERRGWRRIGVLGLGEPVVYTAPLRALGIACTTIAPATRAKLDDAIFRTMEGRDQATAMATAHTAVAELRATGVDGVLLGCTELPVLLGSDADASDLINTNEVLAEAAIAAALA